MDGYNLVMLKCKVSSTPHLCVATFNNETASTLCMINIVNVTHYFAQNNQRKS